MQADLSIITPGPGQIIGLCGHIGSGKTYLAGQVRATSPDIAKLAFATPLKRIVEEVLAQVGVAPTEARAMIYGDRKEAVVPGLPFDVTTRHIMKTLGTEWGRTCIHPDLWVILAMKAVDQYLARGLSVIIDDVRLPNEAAAIVARGGRVVLVTRPGVERASDHISDALPPYHAVYRNEVTT